MDNANATILIADLEPNLLMGICDILEYSGYATLGARNGEEVLDVLADPGERLPDLILTDISFPVNRMSGLEMLAAIRDHPAWNEIPVIVLSALEGEKIDRARQLGVKAVIEKPFDADDLLATIAECLDMD